MIFEGQNVWSNSKRGYRNNGMIDLFLVSTAPEQFHGYMWPDSWNWPIKGFVGRDGIMELTFVDPATGEHTAWFGKMFVKNVSLDGRRVVSASGDGTLKVWG